MILNFTTLYTFLRLICKLWDLLWIGDEPSSRQMSTRFMILSSNGNLFISKTEIKSSLANDTQFLGKPWTSVLPGHNGYWHFSQVCPHKEFQKMVLISLEHLEKISNFPKLQGCGAKNEPATPKLLKYSWSESLAVKTSYFTH